MASSMLVSPAATFAAALCRSRLHAVGDGRVLHLRDAFARQDHVLQFAIDANDLEDGDVDLCIRCRGICEHPPGL